MTKKASKAGAVGSALVPAPAHRPSDYTLEVGAKVCEQLAEGVGLTTACKAPGMPAARTVYQWLVKHEEFAQMYTRAKDEAADKLADEIVEIADTEEDPNKARVRIDARKWVASKLKPRKYGDRLELDHAGQLSITDSPKLIDKADEILALLGAVR